MFGPHEPIPPPPWFDVMDMTAAEAMSRLMRILIAQGKPIPEDCWPRVRKCIAETVGAQVDEVELDSRLISDLGFE
ncbi:MAG TPA: hypothetical protein VGE52_06930 [Pirellulales bacterium]